MTDNSHVFSCAVFICNSEGHGNNPVVFKTAAPIIIPLGDSGGGRLSVATFKYIFRFMMIKLPLNPSEAFVAL